VDTVLGGPKTLRQVTGVALGAPFSGYEIHLGRTQGPGTARPLGRRADGQAEGAVSADGLVAGSYVHGLFGMAAQRRAWFKRIGVAGSGPDHAADVDAALDEIADTLERCIDLNTLRRIAQG
jgi:adenosylcobyric acid synthase